MDFSSLIDAHDAAGEVRKLEEEAASRKRAREAEKMKAAGGGAGETNGQGDAPSPKQGLDLDKVREARARAALKDVERTDDQLAAEAAAAEAKAAANKLATTQEVLKYLKRYKEGEVVDPTNHQAAVNLPVPPSIGVRTTYTISRKDPISGGLTDEGHAAEEVDCQLGYCTAPVEVKCISHPRHPDDLASMKGRSVFSVKHAFVNETITKAILAIGTTGGRSGGATASTQNAPATGAPGGDSNTTGVAADDTLDDDIDDLLA